MPSDFWGLFKAGLFFGMGLFCAYGLLQLIMFVLNMITSNAGHLKIQ